MPTYTCNRCMKEFKQKSHFTTHNKRKTPCQDNKNKIEEIVNNIVNEKMSVKKNNKPTVADFFCGAGGFSEGFNRSGFNVVFGLDNWKPAIETHDLNHPNCKSVLMNILDLDTPEKIDEVIPDTDIIVGSPPCVSFSNSNKSGKADKTLGIQLIEQYLKIILHKKTKPGSKLKYWIMENVPNSIKFVKDVYTAKELGLDESLPDLEVNNKHILTASDYGSPQGRKRAICGDYIVPEITHTKDNYVHVDKIMKSLGPPLNNNNSKIQDPSFESIKLNKNEVTDHFYDGELPEDWWKKAKRLKQDHGYMGKMDFPDRTNRLCRTIMATESYCSRESIIFPKEGTNKYRAPTIRELGCLMGFPIDYQFTGNSSTTKHKQIGNAVCVHLSKALGDSIKKDMNIKLECEPREIKKMKFNLNDLKEPLFSKYKPKPKKINSKFHIHIPYLKLNQLRVELDNTKSNFDNEEFIWESILHKGAGKNAKNTKMNTKDIENMIKSHNKFTQVKKLVKENLEKKLFNSRVFQEKNCNIENDKDHYSPAQVLEMISHFIKNLDVSGDSIKNTELDNTFQNKNEADYPIEIIFGFYITNKVCDFVSREKQIHK